MQYSQSEESGLQEGSLCSGFSEGIVSVIILVSNLTVRAGCFLVVSVVGSGQLRFVEAVTGKFKLDQNPAKFDLVVFRNAKDSKLTASKTRRH